jgi:ASC-1-like (ASCH) protein
MSEPEFEAPRERFVLDETGFDEVPRKYRKFYRKWNGEADPIGPNEVLCPVCKVVVRSTREIREGDRIYCMACMTRLRVVKVDGRLEGHVEY